MANSAMKLVTVGFRVAEGTLKVGMVAMKHEMVTLQLVTLVLLHRLVWD
jgi:hypothetical protein